MTQFRHNCFLYLHHRKNKLHGGNKMKKLVLLVVLVLAVTSITAFAYAAYSTPADIISGLTGKTVDEVTEQKLTFGGTYGQIAIDEDVFEEFKNQMLESKKAYLDEKVKDGSITQEQADDFYNSMLERQEYCDGSGNGSGRGMMGFGFGNRGMGRGFGQQGNGQGFGCRGWQ